jgi:hypothetical protein
MADDDEIAKVDDYIKEFIAKAKDGKVLTYDISKFDLQEDEVRQKLTKKETKERKAWATTREKLREYYLQRYRVSFPASCEEMLRLRVAPPVLSFPHASHRSTASENRALRHYPEKITAWNDFEQHVNEFQPEKFLPGKAKYANVLRESLYDKAPCSNEVTEQNYIRKQVLEPLKDAGLLKYENYSSGESLPGLKGRLDMVLIGDKGEDNNTRYIPIEFKSTHNLLVPDNTNTIFRRYNEAAKEILGKKGQAGPKKKKARTAAKKKDQPAQEEANDVKRTVAWCNIAHPLAQILGYMALNHSRYGVLSSGTRTYFICVNEDGVPSISNAWRVGQEHYLRAWSHFFKVSRTAQPLTDEQSKQWEQGTPTNSPDNSNKRCEPNNEENDGNAGGGQGSGKPKSNNKRKRDGTSGTNRKRDGTSGTNTGGAAGAHELSKTTFATGPSSKIPKIDSKEIEFLGLLGHGNHEVQLARWKGQTIAVKLFDMIKDYKWFEREVKAYEHLEKVWGELVPRPYFISEMYGGVIAVLGMQLGRDPNTDDKHFYRERARLFSKLLHDYGFDHLDTDRGNVIYIRDGKGKERLVAMDLESHEIRHAHE